MTRSLPLSTIDWGAELGLSWGDLLLVVLAATGIYLVVVLVTKWTGPRPLAPFLDLRRRPVGGHRVAARSRRAGAHLAARRCGRAGRAVGPADDRAALRNGEGAAFLEPEARLLVWQGDPIEEAMDIAGLSRWDLHAQLRGQGIGDLAQVQAAVFERDGAVTVVHADTPLDARMLVDVSGLPDAIAAAARE